MHKIGQFTYLGVKSQKIVKQYNIKLYLVLQKKKMGFDFLQLKVNGQCKMQKLSKLRKKHF